MNVRCVEAAAALVIKRKPHTTKTHLISTAASTTIGLQERGRSQSAFLLSASRNFAKVAKLFQEIISIYERDWSKTNEQLTSCVKKKKNLILVHGKRFQFQFTGRLHRCSRDRDSLLFNF